MVEAENMDRARELLATRCPVVILIEDDGSSGFTQLQEHARSLSIAVVAMTSTFSEAANLLDDAAVSTTVLAEPFSLGTMLAEVCRVRRAQMVAGGQRSFPHREIRGKTPTQSSTG